MKNIIIFTLVIFFLSVFTYPQTTPQPTPPPGGTNSVVFLEDANSYVFSYSGPDGDLSYYFSLDSGGSLHALTATVNNSFTFWPSHYGGVVLKVNGISYNPSQHDYSLMNVQLIENKLYVDWLAIPPSKVHVEYYYRYTMYIDARTLIIKVEKDSNGFDYATEFNLDCSYSNPSLYNDVNSYIIGVPYLNLFNVLYTGNSEGSNNNVFTSFFFDWEVTNCSELIPLNEVISAGSVKYSQNALYNEKTDITRNPLSEIIYLTISPKLEDVFPNIPNPVSTYRDSSINRIIFDTWRFDSNAWGGVIPWALDTLQDMNISNCWMIIHPWQKYGYDCGYPTDVMPANLKMGGPDALMNVRNKAVIDLGYLFSLHEDYWFIQEGVPYFDKSKLALEITDYHWCKNDTNKTQHPIKNTFYSYYYNLISPDIHTSYGTNSTYDDAFTNAPPGLYVDYDSQVEGSGKFSFALQKLRQAGPDLRTIHDGPVSAEGGSHFLFTGYFDDFEAEILTGQHYAPGFKLGGYYRPLLVNFDLLKMRQKSFVHGMGYYDRFFCSGKYYSDCWGKDIEGFSHDSVLIYTATELAYAHGGFFRPVYSADYFSYQARIQYNSVYPMQSLYADAAIVSILYNDNGTLLTASEYIKKYPNEFDCFTTDGVCDNANFMGQVRVEYDNGVIVYVNRHPWKHWIVNGILLNYGWYNYHVDDGTNEPVVNTTGLESYDLPPENGWVCYAPPGLVNDKINNKTTFISPYKYQLSQNYPNPFNPKTEINYEIANDVTVSIKVYNILGELVTTLVNDEYKKAGRYKVEFNGTNYASGVYFYKIQAGDFSSVKKMVLIK